MKLALMQPYFFPYIGYYSMIKNVDIYIYLDEVQYIYQGWIDRNRILKPEGDWQYIRASLKKHSSTELIKNVCINNAIPWKMKIMNQLMHYKKHAPYFNETMRLLEEILEPNIERISEFNIFANTVICKYLSIQTETIVLSEMDLQFNKPNSADEWGMNLCKAIKNIDEYWNAPGGKSFFDPAKYKENKIELKFQRMILEPYAQKTTEFEAGLSILDVLMFNSVEEITFMLDRYEFI